MPFNILLLLKYRYKTTCVVASKNAFGLKRSAVFPWYAVSYYVCSVWFSIIVSALFSASVAMPIIPSKSVPENQGSLLGGEAFQCCTDSQGIVGELSWHLDQTFQLLLSSMQMGSYVGIKTVFMPHKVGSLTFVIFESPFSSWTQSQMPLKSILSSVFTLCLSCSLIKVQN